jgi:hypothetical protein
MFGAVLRFFRRKHSFAESVTNITVSFRKLPQKMEKEKLCTGNWRNFLYCSNFGSAEIDGKKK